MNKSYYPHIIVGELQHNGFKQEKRPALSNSENCALSTTACFIYIDEEASFSFIDFFFPLRVCISVQTS